MEKKTLVWIISIVLLVLIAGFFVITMPDEINNILNKIFAGEPDKTCNVDSDCVIKVTNCATCGCGEAVNKNWHSFCPLPLNYVVMCKMCVQKQARCIENKCEAFSK
jgi:hypothetical protein